MAHACAALLYTFAESVPGIVRFALFDMSWRQFPLGRWSRRSLAVFRGLLIVTPGIRPVQNRLTGDQKRTVDVARAFANGADYIVVGRPIREAPDPRAAAQAIQATIASEFPG